MKSISNPIPGNAFKYPTETTRVKSTCNGGKWVTISTPAWEKASREPRRELNGTIEDLKKELILARMRISELEVRLEVAEASTPVFSGEGRAMAEI